MDYHITKSVPIPYYYQIQLRLKEAIDQGEWSPNEFIPPERELSDKFRVSRITMKKAIINLGAEGYLKIIKGKGAVVSHPKIEEHLFYDPITTFQELKEKGYAVENKVLKFEIIYPEKEITKNLKLGPADQVYHVKRMRILNNEPYHYTEGYLPFRLYENLNADDIEKNAIYDLITKKYKQKIHQIFKFFEASKTSFTDSKLFKTTVNFPLLYYTNKTINIDDIPIEFSYNKIRGDLSKFKLVIDVNKK